MRVGASRGEQREPIEIGRPRPLSPLEIFALCGFAVAAPLFDLLGSNAEFFVAHGAGAGLLLGVALGLISVPALACIAMHEIASLLGPRSAVWSGLAWLTILLGLALLVPLQRSEALSEPIAYGLAALIALLFILTPELRPLLTPPVETTTTLEPSASAPPIVMVVLDELPLSSIQAADGGVDGVRFPAFAALADEGTLHTGVSSVSIHTDPAMPAILTGRYPGLEAQLPILAAFPENLFSLLAQRYRLNVMESVTLFHPESALADDLRRAGSAALVPDITLVYLHLILPSALREQLPTVSNNWALFWERAGIAAGGAEEQGERRERLVESRLTAERQVDLERFGVFLESLSAAPQDDRPPLHFVLIVFPHEPWRVLPSGSVYMPDRSFGLRMRAWPNVEWWSTDAYRRHLLQSMYADRILGKLVAELRRSGLYDRTVLIVLADHGGSFWPGSAFRATHGVEHPEDVLSVPLIIRTPEGPRGERVDRFGEIIDILPTLAELARFEVPWRMDGCSLVDTGCPARPHRRQYGRLATGKNVRVDYPVEVVERTETLERKLSLFGTDEHGL